MSRHLSFLYVFARGYGWTDGQSLSVIISGNLL